MTLSTQAHDPCRQKKPTILYETNKGKLLLGDSSQVLEVLADSLAGSVDLIFTSPPFALINKKSYGNLNGESYIKWLSGFAPLLKKLLRPRGSLVVELGNAWVPGSPTMSPVPLEALLGLMNQGGFHLCQQFIWYNKARLPSPVQWVNIERIRVKDAFTHLWWMSPSERPIADNRRVLVPYSKAMLNLLKTGKYNSGHRPSEHSIGETSFLKDNGGAIPPNVIVTSNTRTSDSYLSYCRSEGFKPHPARMPIEVAEFFVKLLTRRNGLVLDPFAGCNTTGAAAEREGRRWLSIEIRQDYGEASYGWFVDPESLDP
jgi:DNA modification methylase